MPAIDDDGPELELEEGEEIVARGLKPYKLEMGVRSITLTQISTPGGVIRRRWGRTGYPDGWRILDARYVTGT